MYARALSTTTTSYFYSTFLFVPEVSLLMLFFLLLFDKLRDG